MDGDRRAPREPGDRPFDSGRPVLSAIVFADLNEDTILRAVSSLVLQDFDEPFEVIVATSGGDRTGELVRQRFPDVRVVESQVRLMPGGARNLGMTVSSGQTRVSLGGLHRSSGLDPEQSRCAQGRDTERWRAPSRRRIPRRRRPVRRRPSATTTGWRGRPRAPQSCRSYGLSFTRDLLRRAGPFDEALRTKRTRLWPSASVNLGSGRGSTRRCASRMWGRPVSEIF